MIPLSLRSDFPCRPGNVCERLPTQTGEQAEHWRPYSSNRDWIALKDSRNKASRIDRGTGAGQLQEPLTNNSIGGAEMATNRTTNRAQKSDPFSKTGAGKRKRAMILQSAPGTTPERLDRIIQAIGPKTAGKLTAKEIAVFIEAAGEAGGEIPHLTRRARNTLSDASGFTQRRLSSFPRMMIHPLKKGLVPVLSLNFLQRLTNSPFTLQRLFDLFRGIR